MVARLFGSSDQIFLLQRERINSNLIDLNSPTATNVEHDYVNERLGQIDSADNTSTSTATAVSTSSNSNFRDVFDMRKYNSRLVCRSNG